MSERAESGDRRPILGANGDWLPNGRMESPFPASDRTATSGRRAAAAKDAGAKAPGKNFAWNDRQKPRENTMRPRHGQVGYGTRHCPHPIQHSERSWESMLVDFPVRSFARGKDLLAQGQEPSSVFLLRDGLVKLVQISDDGRGTIVGIRRSGSLLGLTATLLGEFEPLTVTTLSRCSLIEVPAAGFVSLMQDRQDVSWRVHMDHSRELNRELEQLAEMASRSARERLTRFLRTLTDEIGGARAPLEREGFEVPLRDWEIAQLLGITPQYMCRLLQEFHADGQARRSGTRWRYYPRESCESARSSFRRDDVGASSGQTGRARERDRGS
jgi:CRP-like cAMP-binding protein